MSNGGVGGDGASVSGKSFAFVILPENSGEHGGMLTVETLGSAQGLLQRTGVEGSRPCHLLKGPQR